MTPIVAFQSAQTGNDTGAGGAITLTKPVSLAVGDLLIAQIVINSGAGTASLTGWSVELTTSSASLTSVILSKIADAGDVAGSEFVFTKTSAVAIGGVARFTTPYAANVVDQAHGTADANDTGITPTLGDGTFLIFAATRDTDGVFATTSAYAITTENPATWTEGYDYGENSGGVGFGCGMAYAAKSSLTATGDVSYTASDSLGSFITQIINLPATPISVIGASFSVPAITAVTSAPQLSSAFTILEPTTPEISEFTNLSKSSAAFSNLSKS